MTLYDVLQSGDVGGISRQEKHAGDSLAMPTGRNTGRVKWFNNAKGYGFILAENSSEDYFVHYSSIQMEGYRTLKAGQQVSFDLLEGPKGIHAININLLEGDVEPDEKT